MMVSCQLWCQGTLGDQIVNPSPTFRLHHIVWGSFKKCCKIILPFITAWRGFRWCRQRQRGINWGTPSYAEISATWSSGGAGWSGCMQLVIRRSVVRRKGGEGGTVRELSLQAGTLQNTCSATDLLEGLQGVVSSLWISSSRSRIKAITFCSVGRGEEKPASVWGTQTLEQLGRAKMEGGKKGKEVTEWKEAYSGLEGFPSRLGFC